MDTLFLSHVIKDPSGCLIWTGSRVGNYGHLGRRYNGKLRTMLAHRFAYEYLIGPIPKGLQIDHLCKTPLCVNVAHMEVVTSKINCERGKGSITHCPQGHFFSKENTYVAPRSLGRHCRICMKARKERLKIA